VGALGKSSGFDNVLMTFGWGVLSAAGRGGGGGALDGRGAGAGDGTYKVNCILQTSVQIFLYVSDKKNYIVQ
jgi:hypothetical protein